MRQFLTRLTCTGMMLGLTACGQQSSNEAADIAAGNVASNQIVAIEPDNLSDQNLSAPAPAVEPGPSPEDTAKSAPAEKAVTREAPKPVSKAEPKVAPKAEPKPAVKETAATPSCAPEHRALGHC